MIGVTRAAKFQAIMGQVPYKCGALWWYQRLFGSMRAKAFS